MIKDELKPSIKKNIVLNFIVQLICYISPLIVSPYLSRVLGAENIGIYSFSYSYAHYFFIFASFGFINFGAKQISVCRDDFQKRNRIFWNVFFSRIVFVLISIGVYLLLLFLNFFPNIDDFNVMLVFLLSIGSVVFDITYFFKGIEKINVITLSTAIVNILYVACIFLFVKSSNDLLLYTFLKTMSTSLIYYVLWIFAIKRISKPIFSFKLCFNMIKGSFAFFLPSLVMSVSASIDQTLIGVFSTNVQVAFYQQSTKITSLLLSIITAISPVILSRISLLAKEKENNIQTIKSLTAKSILLSIVILIPLIVGLYVTGSRFIELYFGDEFADAVFVFYWLLPNSIISAISLLIITAHYYPTGRTKKVTIFIFISILINIGLTILLLNITTLGAVAAAIASLVANVFVLIVIFYGGRESINLQIVLSDGWKILLSAFAIAAVLVPLNLLVLYPRIDNYLITILIDVGLGGFIYIALLLILKEHILSECIRKALSYIFKKGKGNNASKID